MVPLSFRGYLEALSLRVGSSSLSKHCSASEWGGLRQRNVCTGHSQAVGIEGVYSGCTAYPEKQLSRQRAKFLISAVHSKRCPLGKCASGNEYCPHAVMKSEASAELTWVSVPL